MSRCLLVLVRLVAAGTLGFLASVATADGKVFGEPLTNVTIPDQSALVVWDGTEQQLAIETRAVGEGTRFAWVVPLPARPTSVEPLSPGVFPTLRAMTRPAVKSSDGVLWFAAVLAWVVIPLAWMVGSGGDRRAVFTFFFVSVSFVAFGLLLPSLGKARSSSGGPADAGVRLLDRRLVGSYEVEVVSSADPMAMSAWLAERGLASTPAADRVIGEYVREGWVFVASQLQREASTLEPMTPHPLVFRFPTRQMVYPVRLTATDGRPLGLELYVAGTGLGNQGVRAAGLTAERSAQLQKLSVEKASNGPWQVGEDPVAWRHSALEPLLEGSATLTKLSGQLSTRQMSRDVSIQLTGRRYEPTRETTWTPAAAESRAYGLALLAGTAVVFLAAMIARARRLRRRRQSAADDGRVVGGAERSVGTPLRNAVRLVGATGFVSLVAWAATTLALADSVVEVRASPRAVGFARAMLLHLEPELQTAVTKVGPAAMSSDESWQALVDRVVQQFTTGFELGELGLTRGDGPWQYRAERLDAGVGRVHVVDFSGVQRTITIEVPRSGG